MIFFLISIVIPDCCRGRLPECEIEGMFFFLHSVPKFRFYYTGSKGCFSE